MKRSDVNHLRRLVAWVDCEVGQDPDEIVATLKGVADKLGHPDIDDAAKARMVAAHDRARSIPKYVRSAVKALDKYLKTPGEIVDEPYDVIHGPDSKLLTLDPEDHAAFSDRCAYLSGLCASLGVAANSGADEVWQEIVNLGGQDLIHFVTKVKPEQWSLAGFDRYMQEPDHLEQEFTPKVNRPGNQ